MTIEPGAVKRLQSLIALTTGDLYRLRAMEDEFLEALPGIMDKFYVHLASQEWCHEYIKGPEAWRHHRAGLREWLVTLMTLDDAELEDVAMHVGLRHAELGIQGSWVIGADTFLRNTVVSELSGRPGWSQEMSAALDRRWSYGVALVLASYEAGYRERWETQQGESATALEDLRSRMREAAALNAMLRDVTARLPGTVKLRGDMIRIVDRAQKIFRR